MNQNRDAKGHFAEGNEIWMMGVHPGRPKKFENRDQLWEACLDYFYWSYNNPLYEEKSWCHLDKVITHQTPKPRPMTIHALVGHLNIARSTWHEYAKDPEFAEVCAGVQDFIFTQKFEGAALGLFKHSFIAHELNNDRISRRVWRTPVYVETIRHR